MLDNFSFVKKVVKNHYQIPSSSRESYVKMIKYEYIFQQKS